MRISIVCIAACVVLLSSDSASADSASKTAANRDDLSKYNTGLLLSALVLYYLHGGKKNRWREYDDTVSVSKFIFVLRTFIIVRVVYLLVYLR